MTTEVITLSEMTDDGLAALWLVNDEQRRDAKGYLDTIEAEMLARLRGRGAKSLPVSSIDVELKPGTPTYDNDLLVPFIEGESKLPDEDLAKAYTAPEWVLTEPKWHGGQLNRIESAYGGEIADRIQRARIPGAETLRVKPKEA